jgi:hypothetical protein
VIGQFPTGVFQANAFGEYFVVNQTLGFVEVDKIDISFQKDLQVGVDLQKILEFQRPKGSH